MKQLALCVHLASTAMALAMNFQQETALQGGSALVVPQRVNLWCWVSSFCNSQHVYFLSFKHCFLIIIFLMFYSTGNYTSIDVCTCPEFNYTGGKCQPGTYCPSGASAPVDCDGGWYCEDYELPAPSGE